MNSSPEPLYQLISSNFKLEDLEILSARLKVDYEDLGGSSKKLKAMNLQEYMSNRGRITELLGAIYKERPRLDLNPYLYLAIADLYYNEAAIVSLLQRFQIEARDFGGSEIHSWGSEAWREQKALALQAYMQDNGRVSELIRVIEEEKPGTDLSFFQQESATVPTPPSPVVTKPVEQGVVQPPPSGKTSKVKPVPSAMAYEDFELRIGWPRDGKYPVEVTESPVGEMSKPVWIESPLDDAEFVDLYDFTSELISEPQEVQKLGEKLRAYLFPGEVWNMFYASRATTRSNKKGLRIRLRIDSPELARLPWEYCFHEQFQYLALRRESPLVRYIAAPFAAGDVSAPRPLRVLVAIAGPKDQPDLDMEGEEARIRQGLEPLGNLVEVEVLRHATADKLQQKLAQNFHILHFSGHGIRTENGMGALAFEDDSGGTHALDANQLMFLLGDSVKVAVLNACQTTGQSGGDAFLDVAPALVEGEIPAVIAMQFPVPDETGLIFTRNLYAFLAAGKPLDAAVTEMRIGAFIKDKDKLYWGIPVLFMRAKDGVIWQPASPKGETESDPAEQLVQTVIQYNIGSIGGDFVEGTKMVQGDEVQGNKEEVHGDKAGGDIVHGPKVGGDYAGGDMIKGNISISATGGSAVSLTGDASVTKIENATREDFNDLLLKISRDFEAIKDQLQPDDAEDAAADLEDIQRMAAEQEPNGRRLLRKLGNVTEIVAAIGTTAAVASQLAPQLQQAAEMAKALFAG